MLVDVSSAVLEPVTRKIWREKHLSKETVAEAKNHPFMGKINSSATLEAPNYLQYYAAHPCQGGLCNGK